MNRHLARALTASALIFAAACGSGQNRHASEDVGTGTSTTAPSAVETSAVPSQAPNSAAATATAVTPTERQQLQKAVTAYSDAFLTGDAKAYDLLSNRCRARMDKNYFIGMLLAAKTTYGRALPIRSFKAKISDDMARVTYTYDLASINQTGEPWVREGIDWHNDDC